MNFLDILLEILKIITDLVRSLQRDDPLTMERNGENWKVSIPKSILIVFIIVIGGLLLK